MVDYRDRPTLGEWMQLSVPISIVVYGVAVKLYSWIVSFWGS